jgi:uncharacterized coiled-coil DUF342 family protein
MSEVRRSEVRGQRSEVRGQRSEVRSQRSEIRGQKSEVRNQRSEITRRARLNHHAIKQDLLRRLNRCLAHTNLRRPSLQFHHR